MKHEAQQDDAIATEAIDWFLRVDREEPSMETLAAWQQWLERSPRNRREYEATQRTWQKLDSVETPRLDAAMSSRIRPRRTVSRWVLAGSLAAAAALVAVVVRVQTVDVYRTGVETPVAQHREVVLPDQSRVIVGARSSIKVKYTAELREVKLLEGEAFFTVAKDAQRPFVVDAGMSKVTAVGTAFNVRRYGDAVNVEVSEGRVRLENAPRDLEPGQEAVVNKAGEVQALRALPRQDVAAWRDGRHSYIDEPLALVVADINRYATQRLVIEDAELAGLRMTTTFFSGDVQGWLKTLETAVPGVAVERGDGGVRIFRR